MNQASAKDYPTRTNKAASPSRGPSSRSPSQRSKIISLLRERGKQGALNYELARIGLRYSSRLRECRIQGFKIETDHICEDLYRYRLVEKPVTPKPLPAYEPRKSTDTVPPLFAGVSGER